MILEIISSPKSALASVAGKDAEMQTHEETVTTVGLPANVTLLQLEIGHVRNRLTSALFTRDRHPTYGYTKKQIQANFDELRGMLLAYQIVMGGNPMNLSAQTCELFNVDLAALRTQIKES